MSAGAAAARSMDVKRYRRLLAKAVPKVIETEAENRAALETINKLVARGDDKRTREETALLDLLATLVEQFERNRYPIGPVEPRAMLLFLMESNGMKATDLAVILGTRARVSEILAGKRSISKAQAKKLGERFRVSPALFL
jgi:HTH-type transcriptional regulator / antitoxin HigA